MRVSAIAIISKNRGLGYENHLLFHIPGELPRLKKITMGHPVIMGRKTYESIGKPLPGRTNIIISRDPEFKVDGAIVVSSVEDAVEKGKKREKERVRSAMSAVIPAKAGIQKDGSPIVVGDDNTEIFILGGGQIFQEALPQTDRLYLTIVDHEVPADTFFPDYEKEFTKVIEKEEKTDWEYPYRFITLQRNT